jgi:hypothetical protein
MWLLFELTAIWALIAMAFVFGRIYEIRQHEIRRTSQDQNDRPGFKIPTAYLPNLN